MKFYAQFDIVAEVDQVFPIEANDIEDAKEKARKLASSLSDDEILRLFKDSLKNGDVARKIAFVTEEEGE